MTMLQMRTDAEAIAASFEDPESFAEVFDRHFPPLHRFVRRRVGRELAEDIAAETFAVAFRQRSRYDGSPDARAWLFGIAVNLLRRHHRTERRELLAFARSPAESGVDMGLAGAEDRLDAVALRRTLALALSTLREPDRDVMLLFAWADLSYEEIARALSIPVGTVRSRLHRGRRRLRGVLRAYGISTLSEEPEGE
jgi:RNA polymerase sigma factor (sigma-70 family)